MSKAKFSNVFLDYSGRQLRDFHVRTCKLKKIFMIKYLCNMMSIKNTKSTNQRNRFQAKLKIQKRKFKCQLILYHVNLVKINSSFRKNFEFET